MILEILFCIVLPQGLALYMVINELPLVIDNLITSAAGLTCCIKLFFLWRHKEGKNYFEIHNFFFNFLL